MSQNTFCGHSHWAYGGALFDSFLSPAFSCFLGFQRVFGGWAPAWDPFWVDLCITFVFSPCNPASTCPIKATEDMGKKDKVKDKLERPNPCYETGVLYQMRKGTMSRTHLRMKKQMAPTTPQQTYSQRENEAPQHTSGCLCSFLKQWGMA